MNLIELDKEITLWINGLHSEVWDTIMWYTSGRYTFIPLYLLLFYLIYKKFGIKEGLLALGFVMLTFALTDRLSVIAFKEVFLRLRPSHNEEIKDLLHIVRDYRGGLYGFVSSHAANVFGLAMICGSLLKKTWITIALLLWASIVSYSRVYLGVHFFGDIFCGALLGVLMAYISYKLYLISLKTIKNQATQDLDRNER